MAPQVDDQTRRIVQYLSDHRPEYLRQIEWMSNPVARLLDLILLGALGRFLLERGRKASGAKAIELLSKAIATTSSKAVMAKALFYRGNYLFDGAADADASIADYSLAVWCDPSDCWARKDRATIYEMYRASYGKGDEDFQLPMTQAGACADAEAAIAFFQSIMRSHPSPEMQAQATRMARQCEEVLQKLRAVP